MRISLDVLDGLRAASPCSARWEDMAGDDRVRHCAACDLDVFNVAGLTREEAATLIRERLVEPGGRVCVRLTRRADGTVLTRDCPVGLARVRRLAAASRSRLMAVATLLLGFGLVGVRAGPRDEVGVAGVRPVSAAVAWVRKQVGGTKASVPARCTVTMGAAYTGF